MIKCFIAICLLLTQQLVGQIQQPPFRTGFFKGGNCMDGGVCGSFFLQSDYTFFFIGYEKGVEANRLGKGFFCFSLDSATKDTVINFSFNNYEFDVFLDNKVEYSSQTKHSLDSIYIAGSVQFSDSTPVPFVSVLLKGINLGCKANAKGEFNCTFPANTEFKGIELIKLIEQKVYPLSISVNKFNNSHLFKITCLANDQKNIIALDRADNFSLVWSNLNSSSYFAMRYISSERETFIKEVNDIANKSPFLSDILTRFISKVKAGK